MKSKSKTNTVTKKRDSLKEKSKGYPPYSPEEDIFVQDERDTLDPEELESGLMLSGKHSTPDRANKRVGAIDHGLDIPGAELDDNEEAAGNEDEENNYYSLGGDNHAGLEEDKG